MKTSWDLYEKVTYLNAWSPTPFWFFLVLTLFGPGMCPHRSLGPSLMLDFTSKAQMTTVGPPAASAFLHPSRLQV